MAPEARKFDDVTTWEVMQFPDGTPHGYSDDGWMMPGKQDRYISPDDPVWQRILERARQQYGDPGIKYNTDDIKKQRYLEFPDGTRLPQDGKLVYRDSATGKYWIQNKDNTATLANAKFEPVGEPVRPARFLPTADGHFMPVDKENHQIGPLLSELPPGILADPGSPLPPPPQQPPSAKDKVESAEHSPTGMVPLKYPQWSTDRDPNVANELTKVVASLFGMFGNGKKPEDTKLPDFPFPVATGADSGIKSYNDRKKDFEDIAHAFTEARTEFAAAVKKSAAMSDAGRRAINDAIGTFNDANINENDWHGLLQAETTLLTSAKDAVAKAAKNAENIQENPTADAPTPSNGPSPAPGMSPAGAADPLSGGGGSPLGGLGSALGGGSPLGGMNPLSALGGMNPLGGMGSPMGGGGGSSPLSGLSSALKPLSQLAEAGKGGKDGKDDKKPSITPLNGADPQGSPPPGAATPTAAVTPAAGAPQPGQPGKPTAVPAGNTTGTKPTVTLPDGKVIDAPGDPRAAQAAQNALDHASTGGDAAQKAYAGTGLDLPGDGKNLGAKVDPADMRPGDVLKWQDKTMIAVGPGLVADPHQPGVTHTLEEVLKDQKGFTGIFRPTEVDPTLSGHASAPPFTPQAPQPAALPPPGEHPPAQPPPAAAPAPAAPSTVVAAPAPETVPLSGPAPAAPPGQQAPAAASPMVPQPAPPSPFETPRPPPATRTTRQERVAAGQE